MAIVLTERATSEPDEDRTHIVEELRVLQRNRAVYIKSMNMVGNRLQALVAGTMGYHSGLSEKERTKLFGEAAKLIKRIVTEDEEHPFGGIVMAHTASIDSLAAMRKPIEKKMEQLAGELHVVSWVLEPDQKGFGIMSLATIVGEAGDLSDYPNPGKLWARFGCHPYEKDGESHMGSTWKARARRPGVVRLAAEDWEAFGYSPRRRSIMYVIGENLIKQNGNGPYRRRWLQAKIRAHELHPEWEWKPCDACKGTGRVDGLVCPTCGGLRQKCLHAHRHGMLLATKLLLRELWAEWNGRPEEGIWRE